MEQPTSNNLTLSPTGTPLADIRDVSVDPKLPKEERIAEFLRQIKNPYCFKCGKFTVRAQFADNGVSLERDFDLVQKISSLDTRTAPDGEAVYLFSGLLVCGCCGARMTRKTNTVKGKKYIYYHCPTGKKKGCTHPVMLKEADLIDCVLTSLQAHIRYIVSLDELLDSISEEEINQEEIAKFKAQIADNEVKLEEARQFKATLYENFIANLISKKDYQDLKNLYTERAEQAQKGVRAHLTHERGFRPQLRQCGQKIG